MKEGGGKKERESRAEWLLDHNTSERVSPHYETVSNCTEHLGSHHASVH